MLFNTKHVMLPTGRNPRTLTDVSEPQNGPGLPAIQLGYFARITESFKTQEWTDRVYKADLVKISTQTQYQMKNVDFGTMFTPLIGISACPSQKKNDGLVLRANVMWPQLFYDKGVFDFISGKKFVDINLNYYA